MPSPAPTPHPNPGSNPSTSARAEAAGRRRLNALIWVAVGAFFVWMQWPMLKGSFYRATGATAPISIEWRTNLDAALAESRATGRLVLVDFSADWCPPCVVMKHDTWPDADVRALVAQSYVPVLVDPDLDASASDRYGVSAIPAVLILDGSGEVVARAGYLPASGMRRFLTERRH
jgi:thiol:disulfide interchange protein